MINNGEINARLVFLEIIEAIKDLDPINAEKAYSETVDEIIKLEKEENEYLSTM